MDFQIQKLGDSEKSGESTVMNFNNANACVHALEQKSFFEKLAIYQKLQEISKCYQNDFCFELEIKNILTKVRV